MGDVVVQFLNVTTDDLSLRYSDGSLRVDDAITLESNSTALYLHEIIYRHLYVRNTKQGIGNEYSVPEVCPCLACIEVMTLRGNTYVGSSSYAVKDRLIGINFRV